MLILVKSFLGITAAILVLISYSFYIIDILDKKTKPHVFTWGLWFLIIFILFLLQVSKGAGAGSLPTLFVALLCLVVCILSLIKEEDKNIKKVDIVFLVLTLLAIPLWLLAKAPVASTALLVLVYSLAGQATLRKSWADPYTETISLWAINSFRALISILALSEYNFVTLAFPVLVFVSALGFAIILVIRRRQVSKKKGVLNLLKNLYEKAK
ncbi:hypothetical protein SDC9_07742 [bioreactor metagenome]|uniref:Uncharacterized protein n=1 Tax=bioreactor metagenome TaxID=1076179 RepID=A0A644T5U0_9ZZZZ|nr:hypothetical protein [Candidatus Elulimicrobiales bacterium]